MREGIEQSLQYKTTLSFVNNITNNPINLPLLMKVAEQLYRGGNIYVTQKRCKPSRSDD